MGLHSPPVSLKHQQAKCCRIGDDQDHDRQQCGDDFPRALLMLSLMEEVHDTKYLGLHIRTPSADQTQSEQDFLHQQYKVWLGAGMHAE